MVRRRLLILTAIVPEARAIAAAWRLPTPRPGKPVYYDADSSRIEIHLIGIGAQGLPADLLQPEIAAVVMAGFAGALEPRLHVGDIIVDECPDGLLPATAFQRGKVTTAVSIVSTPAEKTELFQQSQAVAVDMENGVIRERAKAVGVPFISLRSISDSAADCLHTAVLKMVDAYGRPRPMALAGALLRRPKLIGELRRLQRDSRIAAASLAQAVASLALRFQHQDA